MSHQQPIIMPKNVYHPDRLTGIAQERLKHVRTGLRNRLRENTC